MVKRMWDSEEEMGMVW